MTNKLQRCLRNLNRIVSDDYQQLYDKCHNLELSHKRYESLLKRTADLLDYIPTRDYLVSDVERLRSDILEALNCPLYRIRERRK